MTFLCSYSCLCNRHMRVRIFKLVYCISSCELIIYSTECYCYIVCKCSVYNILLSYCIRCCCCNLCSRSNIFEYVCIKCYAFKLFQSDCLSFLINVLCSDCKCDNVTSFVCLALIMCLVNN